MTVVNIAALRFNKGLSVRAAAKEIGVSEDILTRAENGTRPHPSNAKLIADFYGREPLDIWPIEADEVAA